MTEPVTASLLAALTDLTRWLDTERVSAFAHRPKDIEDIEGLLDAHPNTDLDTVRPWLREFATAMTMPDLLNDFEKIVARRQSKA